MHLPDDCNRVASHRITSEAMESNWPEVLFTSEFQTTIRKSRVLLVGAGGIGSEVLKTLVLTGFRKISLVDLDTIEISNLNRQFLFRANHVGESKAKIAAEAVEAFLPPNSAESPIIVPDEKRQKLCDDEESTSWNETTQDHLEVTPYHANIKDSQFNVDFFKSFNVVLNGLDNLDARRHVNRLCLAASVPLIESGTAGYDGNVTVHIKERSHCYECEERPTPKSFPICTIRNTPERMIHCVVWAKDLLFTRLFGTVDETTDLDEEAGNESVDEMNGSFFVASTEESPLDYAMRVFKRVFDQDIENVLKIEKLWTKRERPKPIHWSFEYVYPDPLDVKDFDLHKNLDLEDNVTLFLTSLCTMLDTRGNEIGNVVFEKDDDAAMAFVTSSSNLRALCYGIQTSSFFEIKGMAGNIVHAVATTNALVAGIVVNECCKVIAGCHRFLKDSYIGKHSTFGDTKRKRDVLIKSHMPPSQNPNCIVCGMSMVYITINTKTTTLDYFITKVIKGALSILVPNLSCQGFMYEEGEGLDEDEREDYEAMLPRLLIDLPSGGIHDGSILEVQSQTQHFHCNIVISHKDKIDEEEYPEKFILQGKMNEEEEKVGSPTTLKRKRYLEFTEMSSGVIVLPSESESETELDDIEVHASSSKKKRSDSTP